MWAWAERGRRIPSVSQSEPIPKRPLPPRHQRSLQPMLGTRTTRNGAEAPSVCPEPVLDESLYGPSASWFHRCLGKACNWYKNEGVSILQRRERQRWTFGPWPTSSHGCARLLPHPHLTPGRPSQLWADHCALHPHISAPLLMKMAHCPYFTKQERLRSLARLYPATTESPERGGGRGRRCRQGYSTESPGWRQSQLHSYLPPSTD